MGIQYFQIRNRHKFDYEYWKNNTVDFWLKEIDQQREIIHAYSNVPLDRIKVCTKLFLIHRA